MKIFKCFCIVLLNSINFTLAQQITTDSSIPLEALIQASLGQGCVEITNISSSINGQVDGIASFGSFNKADSNFPFENGIILSTGSISSAGNNEIANNLNEGSNNWLTDADLETTLGITNTLNATAIEFDFTSAADQIAFNYVLASEEYNTNFPCQYSDGFAFLIKKANTPDPYENIALIPGSSTPVNTNTIHDEVVGFCDGQNEEYFEGYNLGDTNYNGRTTVLTARADITPNVLYRVKLIIADQTDQNYDSAVFIQDTNTIASLDLGPDIDLCADSVLLNGDVENSLATYQWYKDGVLLTGAVNPLYLTTDSGTYLIEVTLPIDNTFCTVEDEIIVNLSSVQDINPISDYVLCDDASNDGQELFDLTSKDQDILDEIPVGNYNISYHLTNVDAVTQNATISGPILNSTSPQIIFARVENTDTGCLGYTFFNLVVNPLPEYNEPLVINICDDNVADGITTINFDDITTSIMTSNPNFEVSYHNTQTDAELGESPISEPYSSTGASDVIYIRLINTESGCFNILPLTINVLENPVLNTEIQWINACETDGDGFDVFDITSVTNDILQGLTGVSVDFYETETDAIEGINAIPNPSNYQNTNAYFQIVYIRVTNTLTGCSSVHPIELHTNIVDTGFDTSDYGICDDESNDGIADFDLSEVVTVLLNQYIEWEIDFFETENDQLNNSNALDQSVPYTATSITTTIYFSATLDGCIQYSSIDLIINPAIEIQTLTTVEYCDDDFDGTTSIVLSTFNAYVSTGIDTPSVRYYLTEIDAINEDNNLPSSFINTSNPITVYARVTNSTTGCSDIAPLDILVIDPPVVFQPSDIIICDDDQDGYSIVNLTNSIPEIVADLTDLSISFHTSIEDADSATNPIANPESFNTNTKPVFVRVESLITTCHSIVELNVIVNTLPLFEPISIFEACESDGDGLSDFLFSLKDEEILNGQSGKEVLYFETQQDAIDRTNNIDKNTAYQNLANPQIIYVRVENITDISCFDVSSFQITVTQFVTYNQPTDIDICDDSSNDGFEMLDFNDKIQEISNGININLDISFHLSFEDADLDLNPLPLNYTNNINPQLIYVRIENEILCPAIVQFTVNIIQVPEINPASDLINCDDDYDGLTTFNLSNIETDVLDVRVDDISISYHETYVGAENNTDIILDPENYSNSSNPQTVFIKVTNTVSNCYSIEPINLSVILPPLINFFQTYDTCINATNSFNLNEIEPIIIDDSTDIILSYYTSQSDAQSNSNPLNTIYNYSTNNDIIFSRIEDAITGCFYIYPFELRVNPLPIANQPPDLQICDDASNDNAGEFNLFLVNNAVLGSQSSNDFTVTYYNSETEADLGSNPLTYNYSGVAGEIIYARIENNTTGCHSLTQFNLIVNEHPNIPSQIVNCDTDYDAITSFDLTQAETELFNSANPDNIISYYESLEDLQNDVNAIVFPTNYTNIINPQTVYIKVYNTVADCFTFVPLELEVNLPPAIDVLDTFELCETDTGIVTLSDVNSPLLIQTANVIVTYYASETDALNQINTLDDNYEYQSTSDLLFARVEFSTTHCYYIHEFNLIINPLPIAHIPNDLVACDDNNDGRYSFDLSTQNAMVLNGQSPDEFTVSYYNVLSFAEDNTNALDHTYEGTNGETIYVRVENNTSGCYDITSFEINVHPTPILEIGPQVICLENLPLIVSANTNQIGDTYQWSTNETTPDIEITEVGTYSVTVTSPFGCTTTEVFTVTESQAATMVITENINFSDPNNIIVTVNGIGNYVYQLDDNEPQTSNIFQNVSLGYHTLKIIDLNNCETIIKDLLVIDVPKFMTPNNDGKFDTWHITGVETLPGTIIYIFDRYGKLLKTITSNSPGWNGYYNGKLMPNSDYWFLAKVKDGNNVFEVKGHFSLRY